MKFMRFLFVQLALALFQIDLAVKQEIEQLPEQEEEHLIPGGVVGIKRLHNHGMAGGKAVGHMGSIIKVSGIITLGCIGAFARSLISLREMWSGPGGQSLRGELCQIFMKGAGRDMW